MSTNMCVKELHGILGIASLLSLNITKGGLSLGLLYRSGSRV